MIDSKTFEILIFVDLKIYVDKIDKINIYHYKKIIELICYLIVNIKLDKIKTILKFLEFFINLNFDYIKTAI